MPVEECVEIMQISMCTDSGGVCGGRREEARPMAVLSPLLCAPMVAPRTTAAHSLNLHRPRHPTE